MLVAARPRSGAARSCSSRSPCAISIRRRSCSAGSASRRSTLGARRAAACSAAKVTLAELRAHWPWLVVVGLLNTAVPFWLLSWGETRIDSGPRVDHPGVGADLQRAARVRLLPRAARQRAAASSASRSASSASRCSSARSRRRRSSARSRSSAWRPATPRADCSRATTSPRCVRRWSRSARPAIAAFAMLPTGVIFAPDHVPGWKTIASVVVPRRRRDGVRLLALLHDHRRRRRRRMPRS